MRVIRLQIHAGEKTCAVEPGVFCPHMRVNMRQQYTCQVFGRELADERGQMSGDGWLQRLPECLAAEVKP